MEKLLKFKGMNIPQSDGDTALKVDQNLPLVNDSKLITWQVNDSLLGCTISSLDEIISQVDYTPTYSSHSMILGLCNVRGQVVHLLRNSWLLTKLGLEHKAQCDETSFFATHALIFKFNDLRYGFITPELGPVIDTGQFQLKKWLNTSIKDTLIYTSGNKSVVSFPPKELLAHE